MFFINGLSKRYGYLIVSLVLFSLFAGCSQIPQETISETIEKDELSDHVEFLASTTLQGRKPLSSGSWQARRYIQSRFRAYGLKPWGTSKGYDQSFGFGTNIVGILPGTDPELQKEIIMICAHYDHIGKDEKGTIYPGAADNASGVAALLEIAEKLNRSKSRRTLCFAAFDTEETWLLGAFAFTCRSDFDRAKLTAVVNIDMLGRNFMDVLDHTLLVSGSDQYPQLQRKILDSSSNAMRVVPFTTELTGLRGDHIAFETMNVPCLFFSCGDFRDYHQPTDTAEKLDYSQIKQQAQIICQTITILANQDEREPRSNNPIDYLSDLKNIAWILDEVVKHRDKTDLIQSEIHSAEKLKKQIENMLAEKEFTDLQRRQVFKDIKTLCLMIVNRRGQAGLTPSSQPSTLSQAYVLALEDFIFQRRASAIEEFRKMVGFFLDHPPGLFTKPAKYTMEIFEVPDDNFSLTYQSDHRYRMCYLLTKMKVEFSLNSILSSNLYNCQMSFFY